MGSRAKGVSGQEILSSRIRGCVVIPVEISSRQACVGAGRVGQGRFGKAVESHQGFRL